MDRAVGAVWYLREDRLDHVLAVVLRFGKNLPDSRPPIAGDLLLDPLHAPRITRDLRPEITNPIFWNTDIGEKKGPDTFVWCAFTDDLNRRHPDAFLDDLVGDRGPRRRTAHIGPMDTARCKSTDTVINKTESARSYPAGVIHLNMDRC